jgi:hypothetical protein
MLMEEYRAIFSGITIVDFTVSVGKVNYDRTSRSLTNLELTVIKKLKIKS